MTATVADRLAGNAGRRPESPADERRDYDLQRHGEHNDQDKFPARAEAAAARSEGTSLGRRGILDVPLVEHIDVAA